MKLFKWYRDDNDNYFFIVRETKHPIWPYVTIYYDGSGARDPWGSTRRDYDYIRKSRLVEFIKIPDDDRERLVKSFFESGNWIIIIW
jgi:hypothetical protein